MQLCSNRPEGFGPHSGLHRSLPTTCFLDVVVTPLATWIFLLLSFILTIIRVSRRRHSTRLPANWAFRPGGKDYTSKDMETSAVDDAADPAYEPASPRSAPSRRGWVLASEIIYHLLLVAQLAMVSLEIARLSAARLGLGLLPFTYAGIVMALAQHSSPVLAGRLGRRWGSKAARAINALFWLMLAGALALQVATEQMEVMSDMPGVRREKDVPTAPGVTDSYPTSDEMLDNAVMLGVALVLGALEWVGLGGMGWL